MDPRDNNTDPRQTRQTNQDHSSVQKMVERNSKESKKGLPKMPTPLRERKDQLGRPKDHTKRILLYDSQRETTNVGTVPAGRIRRPRQAGRQNKEGNLTARRPKQMLGGTAIPKMQNPFNYTSYRSNRERNEETSTVM